MFVIENFLESRRKSIRAWEVAREKVNERSDYASQVHSWENSNPKPKSIGYILKTAWTVFLILAVLATIAFKVNIAINDYNSPEAVAAREETARQKEEQKKAEEASIVAEGGEVKDCRKFNKGDFVIVQYGSYKDKTGTVIGGCNEDEAYQVKLTENQTIISQGDEITVGGNTLGVDSGDNLVKISPPQEDNNENKEEE